MVRFVAILVAALAVGIAYEEYTGKSAGIKTTLRSVASGVEAMIGR